MSESSGSFKDKRIDKLRARSRISSVASDVTLASDSEEEDKKYDNKIVNNDAPSTTHITKEMLMSAEGLYFREYSLAQFAHLDKMEMLFSEPFAAFHELNLSWDWAHVMARGIHTATREDLRKGVPREGKHIAWVIASSAQSYIRDSSFYSDKLKATFAGREVPERLETSPEFGGEFRPWFHPLLEEGMHAARRVLCTISNVLPELRYCPALNEIVCCLLIFMTEHEAFCVLYSVLVSKVGSHPHTPGNKTEWRRFISGTMRAVVKEVPKVTAHLQACGINLAALINDWLSCFFVGVLPYPTILQLVDSYLTEGFKFIVRLLVAVLKLYSSQIIKQVGSGYSASGDRARDSLDALINIIGTQNELATGVMEAALSVKLTKDKAFASDDEDLNVSLGDDNTFYIPQVEGSVILPQCTIEMLTALWSQFPTRYRFLDAEILFTTEQHGMSMRTLLQKCADKAPLLFLIRGKWVPKKKITTVIQTVFSLTTLVDKPNRDEVPFVLGALFSQPIGDGYPTGDGDTTVFTLMPELKVYKFSPTATPHFVYSSHGDGIFVGERSSPAIVLSSNMENGRSTKCSTFSSPCLLGPDAEEFKTTIVEVLHLSDNITFSHS